MISDITRTKPVRTVLLSRARTAEMWRQCDELLLPTGNSSPLPFNFFGEEKEPVTPVQITENRITEKASVVEREAEKD